MNKIKKITLFSCIALLFLGTIGCEDYLDTENLNSVDEKAFYQTEADFEAATAAIYAAMFALNLEWPQIDGITPYTVTTRSRFSNQFDYGNLNVNGDWFEARRFWAAFYSMIARANTVISKADIAEGAVSQNALDQAKGEALFMRGFAYFNLINLYGHLPHNGISFGGVPLIIKPLSYTESNVPKSTPEEVYAQIEADFTAAIELLPSVTLYRGTDKLGRASKGAAQAMLGKALLFQGKWAAAETALESVITSSDYNLLNNFNDNFWPEFDNSVESLFEIQFEKGGLRLGQDYSYRTTPPGGIGVGGGQWFNQPSQLLVDLFQTINGYDVNSEFLETDTNYLVTDFLGNDMINGKQNFTYHDIYNFTSDDPDFDPEKPFLNRDPRLDYTAMYIGSKYVYDKFETRASGAGYYLPFPDDFWCRSNYNNVKYVVGADYDNPRRDSPKNLILLRYADVLLMFAEANAQQGDMATAANYINKIRDRAGMINVNAESLTVDDIIEERTRELVSECGHVYFDMKRYSKLAALNEGFWDGTPKMRGNYPAMPKFADHYYAWPIPTVELQSNTALKQHEGY